MMAPNKTPPTPDFFASSIQRGLSDPLDALSPVSIPDQSDRRFRRNVTDRSGGT
jgi:hypothetical protein